MPILVVLADNYRAGSLTMRSQWSWLPCN